MKFIYTKQILLLTILVLAFNFSTKAQQARIAVPQKVTKTVENFSSSVGNKFFVAKETNGSFATTVYTFGDITVFSYFDNTAISIYDSGNNLLYSQTLSIDSYKNWTGLTAGVYRIVGNKTYTVLVGDAISNYVNGYYAVDEAGRAVSTKLNTWMMQSYGTGSDFIVFAYNDNTGFTVKDLSNGSILAAGTLNAGQHYSFANSGTLPEKKALQVVGTKPISALSYTDQDYYVPSNNGSFVGTLFYGYSAYVGYWDNDILVTSYSDNNSITITNSNTGNVIQTYNLQRGQVAAVDVTTPTFWTVTSTGPISAANIPFTYTTYGYQYMTRAIDESGRGFGKFFYMPTIGSDIYIFSFENSNNVKVTLLGAYDSFPYSSPTEVWQGTLNEGEYHHFTSPSGRNVYKIESSGYVSAVQSNSGAGADFMPLAYALDYPDLAISSGDIQYSKNDSDINAGDIITVTVTVHNYGSIAASNINCVAYDGDPDAGGNAPIVGTGTISSIAAGSSSTFNFTYKVPTSPEYHNLVIKVDPANQITESNESNNKAQRGIKPNTDLQPPLAVDVTVPSSLLLQNGVLTPNPFTLHLDIFNTGTVAATNVKVTLELFNGLTTTSPLVQNVGSINGNTTATVEYQVSANASISGFNLYKITITADNAPTKVISRAINIPDALPPAAPANFSGQIAANYGAIFTWIENSEIDLAGYFLYYSTDGINWNATGAKEGDSPILIINQSSFTISGLPVNSPNGQYYWFMLKAFDSSNNLSPASVIVQILITQQTSTQVLFYGDGKKMRWTVTPSNPPVPGEVPGYVAGTNKYGDVGKYERFDFSGNASLTEARIFFWGKEVIGSVDNYSLVVRSVGSDGAPKDLLYSKSYSVTDIDTSNFGVTYNSYTLDSPVNVTGSFFVGIEWDATIDDQFGIVADTIGHGDGQKRAWEKWGDGTFHAMNTEWSSGTFDVDLWIAAVVQTATGVEELNGAVPKDFVLYQNYPNPFNPATIIKFAVPRTANIKLAVYDVLGREIATLFNGEASAGYHQVELNGSNLTSGIYFVRFISGNYSTTKKIMLMK